MKINIYFVLIIIFVLGLFCGSWYENLDYWEEAQLHYQRGINYSIMYDLENTYRDRYHECLENFNGREYYAKGRWRGINITDSTQGFYANMTYIYDGKEITKEEFSKIINITAYEINFIGNVTLSQSGHNHMKNSSGIYCWYGFNVSYSEELKEDCGDISQLQ